jgi:capsular polysaccharide export protein
VPRDTNPFESEYASTGPVDAPRPDGPSRPPEQRHFLLVCGPFGPFTRRLGETLRASGARCDRVLLNAGDLYDWGRRHGRFYFGPLSRWGAWLEETIRRDGVTDLILYGDAHPYCVEAAKVGAGLSVKIHVLEQGYFRPFWITLERNGVNGNSGLSKDPGVYRRLAPMMPDPEDVWLPPLTPPAVRKIFLYHAAMILGAPAFPMFRAPYSYPVLRQGLGHVRRYLGQKLFRRRHQSHLNGVLQGEGPLFLAIMQRPGDSQLRVHSGFDSPAAFIDHVVASFAEAAPTNARLLFKSHPLDHGLEPHDRDVRDAAARHGVSGRVFFTDVGDLQAIIPRTTGAVTINSTAGLFAIERGLPTVALGSAIYGMPGLTHQYGLDTFWVAPERPDAQLFEAFRRVVMCCTQVSGAYASRQGVDIAVPNVARRLLAE